MESSTLTSIPPEMKISAAKLIRTFYGQECFAVFSQIQREEGHAREDALSRALKLEVKDIRRIMNRLKADLIVSERRILEGRSPAGQRQIVLSFSVNYKALLNVTRYKLNYIRDQLSGVDKETSVPSGGYACSLCKRAFSDLDVGSLFDPVTRSLKCCYCRGTVEEKRVEVAADTARNSLLWFNGQMADIYAILTRYEGVQFGHGTLKVEEEVQVKKEQCDVIVSTGHGGVDAMETKPMEKSAVPWLQEEARPSVDLSSIKCLDQLTSVPSSTFARSSSVPNISLASSEASSSPHSEKRRRLDYKVEPRAPDESEVNRLLQSAEGIVLPKECSRGGDEEDSVLVEGKRHLIDDMTEELVARMSDEERDAYRRRYRHIWM